MVDQMTQEYLRKLNQNQNQTVVKTATSAILEECQCPHCVEQRRMLQYKEVIERDVPIGRMIKNPSNYYPELSPDYELIMSGKRYKYG